MRGDLIIPAIKPSKEVLDVKGCVAYSISSRAWNTVRLKKEMLDEFPLLRERRSKIDYRMVLCRDPVDLFLAAEKIMDDKDALPILLYFTRRTRQGAKNIEPKKNKIMLAKARAAELRGVPSNSLSKNPNGFREYGFKSAREFVYYHWDKLSEKDKEELMAAGIPAPSDKP